MNPHWCVFRGVDVEATHRRHRHVQHGRRGHGCVRKISEGSGGQRFELLLHWTSKDSEPGRCWLVGGFGTFFYFHRLGIIGPFDFHIFQRGRYTTNQLSSTGWWSPIICWSLHHWNDQVKKHQAVVFFGPSLALWLSRWWRWILRSILILSSGNQTWNWTFMIVFYFLELRDVYFSLQC